MNGVNSNHSGVNLARGIAGASLGGLIGWFAFFWIARQGFYMLVLPGGLLGVGAGLLMKRGSVLFAIACGVVALALGTLAEWRLAPFRAEASLGYFLSHLHQLRPLTLIMIALGGFIGFWAAFRAGRQPVN
jgi:F0F1-type ATP synthase assembly protein I